MIINTSNINEARKQIQSLKKQKKQIIVMAKEPEFNRKILENKDVDILMSPELHSRNDRLKERDSGLNEVLCKIAKKNEVAIGVEIEKIKKLGGEEKARAIARLIQNIKLCKRVGTKIKLFGKFDKRDAMSFLLSLGCSTSQAKEAVS